jgi:sporulation protein YlmC with PRC-barrel domain
MSTHEVWRAGLHVLDHQIVDARGRMAGNVDDLELEERDGALVVTALLSGAAALANRVEGRLGRWMGSVETRLAETDTPSRIDFSLVERIDSAVRLSVAREGVQTNRAEHWVRTRIIDHIPGAGHAPE